MQIPALLEEADNSETDSDDDDDGGSESEDSDSGCKESVHPKDKPAEVSMDKKVSWPGIVFFFSTIAYMTQKNPNLVALGTSCLKQAVGLSCLWRTRAEAVNFIRDALLKVVLCRAEWNTALYSLGKAGREISTGNYRATQSRTQ